MFLRLNDLAKEKNGKKFLAVLGKICKNKSHEIKTSIRLFDGEEIVKIIKFIDELYVSGRLSGRLVLFLSLSLFMHF